MQSILTELGFSDRASRGRRGQQALRLSGSLETKSVSTARDRLRQQIRELEHEGNFAEALRLADELDKMKQRVYEGVNRVVLWGVEELQGCLGRFSGLEPFRLSSRRSIEQD